MLVLTTGRPARGHPFDVHGSATPTPPIRRSKRIVIGKALASVVVSTVAVVLCRAPTAAGAGPAAAAATQPAGQFFGVPLTKTVPTRQPPPVPSPVAAGSPGPVVVSRLAMVADDFVVDVYVNGQPLPQSQRHLKGDVYGAQSEEDEVELRAGDWVVFNVATNGLRWGGSSYFGAAGLGPDKSVAFVTDPANRQWSACDAVSDVPRFLADPAFGGDRAASRPAHVWNAGDREMRKLCPDWDGSAIWGKSHSAWLRYVVPGKGAGDVGRVGRVTPKG